MTRVHPGVMPAQWFLEYEAKESAESRAGVKYVAANGEVIPDQGCKVLNVVLDKGQKRTMQFNLAKVTKPLAAVSQICKAGHKVVMNLDGEEGSYIEPAPVRCCCCCGSDRTVLVCSSFTGYSVWTSRCTAGAAWFRWIRSRDFITCTQVCAIRQLRLRFMGRHICWLHSWLAWVRSSAT